MGAILEPTVQMGPWHVEVRRESAYLTGGPLRFHRADRAERDTEIQDDKVSYVRPDLGVSVVSVRLVDVDNVLAAVDQIISHPAYIAFIANGALDPGRWISKTTHAGWVSLHGPVHGYGTPGLDGWVDASTVELLYSSLADLRNALAAIDR